SLRANCHTVHDSTAAEQAERIIQISKTLLCHGVTAISNETIGLQQTSRTDKPIRVPPERRTGSRTASAQNALIQTIQLVTLFRRLQTLNGRHRRIVHQVRLDLFILRVE